MKLGIGICECEQCSESKDYIFLLHIGEESIYLCYKCLKELNEFIQPTIKEFKVKK